MKRRILLCDTSAVLHSVKYSLAKNKLSHEDEPTFVIYGFLLKLQFMLRKTKAQAVVYAIDSSESKRKELYAPYKEQRAKNKTEEQYALDSIAYPQFTKVIEHVLPTLGYKNILGADGLEGDDVLGRICRKYKNDEIVVVTNDKDIYQLLSDNVCILNPLKNTYYSIEDFREQYGIEPHLWKRIKAIGGCVSDNVEGVRIPDGKGGWSKRGVGEGTALKFVKGTLPDHHKSYKAIVSEQGRKTINRNKSLVILPFKGTPDFRIVQDRLSKKGMKEVCETYGFKSILEDWEDWCHILKLR